MIMFTTWQVICMLTRAFAYGIAGSIGIGVLWYVIRPRWCEGVFLPLDVRVDPPRPSTADSPLVNTQDVHS